MSRRIGRIAWVAKGVVYVLIGVLALKIALSAGRSGEEANTGGAVSAIAKQPSGLALVVVVGVEVAVYGVWRLFTAFLPGDWKGKALLERLGYLLSAGIYVSLAMRSAPDAVDGGSGRSPPRRWPSGGCSASANPPTDCAEPPPPIARSTSSPAHRSNGVHHGG